MKFDESVEGKERRLRNLLRSMAIMGAEVDRLIMELGELKPEAYAKAKRGRGGARPRPPRGLWSGVDPNETEAGRKLHQALERRPDSAWKSLIAPESVKVSENEEVESGVLMVGDGNGF